MGYIPETTKSISVVAPWNMNRAEKLFRVMGGAVVTRRRYLGGLIGYGEAGDTWIFEKVQGWMKLVKTLLGFAHKHFSPLIQYCRSHSDRSGSSCSGSPPT